MRKLIVSNFVTLDGYYENINKTFDKFFDYYHPDYHGTDHFDHYNTERLRPNFESFEMTPLFIMTSDNI